MHLRIRWARVLCIASGLTLFVGGAIPAAASAHGGRKLHGTNARSGAVSASYRAAPFASQALGRTLIFGGGDEAGASLGIAPTESLTNLENMLTSAGYSVDVSATLPKKLTQYKAVWFINTDPLISSEEHELESFVKSGHGVYLTGEPDNCCSLLNSSDSSVINSLVTDGPVEAGGQGPANSPGAPNTVNGSAIDDAALNPNALTGWTPNSPGGMAGVAASNVLTSTIFGTQQTPTGALWDGSTITGGVGRLAILMNINWLESESWNQPTATQMVVNLERFLTSATPVPVSHNSQWAGYAAKSSGVRDVSGEWTVPTVDCSKVAKASAVGVWVGIDGFGNNDLIKAGSGITCASASANPCYYLFTEVLPAAETSITGCGGVTPGDDLSVDVTNSPFGSSIFVVTVKDNGVQVGQPITLTASTYDDKSAECIVQLPPGKVGPTPSRHKELADFGSVSFAQCQATATQSAGTALDVNQLSTGSDDAFTVTSLNMGNSTKSLATTVAPSFPELTWSVSWDSAGS